MPSYAVLLAHDERPSPSTQWPAAPGGNCDGWAEWFSRTPLLFSLLLGDARQLPDLVPCSAYQDKESLSALTAPMEQVKARWQWLHRLLQPLSTSWPEAIQQQWQAIDAAITSSPRQWLLLDCATLCPHDFDEPQFAAFLQAQRDLCQQWDCSASSLPTALQALQRHPEAELGWWSPSVIARTEVIERENDDDWPAWLSEHYEERYHSAWEEELEAYLVTPKLHPHTGLPCKNDDERENWPTGLVTPYGRWLQSPAEGAIMALASGGYIAVRFPEIQAGAGHPSGLKDLNGVWQLPPSAGYRDLYALTPHVLLCKSPQLAAKHDLRSLPGLELLQAGLIDANWQPEDHTLRAWRGEYSRDQELVLNERGQPLFDSQFESVQDFNPKTGLAVASIRVKLDDDEDDVRIYEGVIHISGKQIIPCEYQIIERGFSNSPPKVFPGGKLLAYDYQDRPRVYSTKGKLLASPDIWSPALLRKVVKNELMAFSGERPEAEQGWFSLKDLEFTRTGQTWQDYSDDLRGVYRAPGQGDTSQTMSREELVQAEDAIWLHDIARILSLGNIHEATQLVQEWRDCVAKPDPDDFEWDEDDTDFDPDVMTISGAENALTLYWQHLLAIGSFFLRLDWKDADGLADTHWLPGTDDWHWDKDEQGDGMDDGQQSLAAHLVTRDLALIRLQTDDDSIRYTVVRERDAEDFIERLAQAAVSCEDCS